MSDSSRKKAVMKSVNPGIGEMRLILHCYPNHTTVALVTRDRRGSENWDARQHAWDLPLAQRDYEKHTIEDQLWIILRALAARSKSSRATSWAEPSESPDGDYGGEQLTLDRALGLT